MGIVISRVIVSESFLGEPGIAGHTHRTFRWRRPQRSVTLACLWLTTQKKRVNALLDRHLIAAYFDIAEAHLVQFAHEPREVVGGAPHEFAQAPADPGV